MSRYAKKLRLRSAYIRLTRRSCRRHHASSMKLSGRWRGCRELRDALQIGAVRIPAKEMNVENTAIFRINDVENQKELFAFEVVTNFVQDSSWIYAEEEIDTPEATEEDIERCGKWGEEQGMTKAEMKEIFSPSQETRAVISAWLLDQTVGRSNEDYLYSMCSNIENLIEDFASLEPKVRQAWLKENFADLRAGKVTLKDLP